MKTGIKKAIACAAILGLLITWIGCKCIKPVQVSGDGHLVILQEPQSQIAKEGSTATFSVVAMHVGPPGTNGIAYQWRFNGVVIPGADNSTYTTPPVAFASVGTYDVVVTGSTLTSQPAYLSVYSATRTAGSNGGTLQTPIGNFSSQSFTCTNGTFTKGFSPTNSDGTPALFYGPNASSQTGPFVNTTSGSTTCTVNTFSGSNGNLDTGLRFRGNWSGLPMLNCNDDANPPNQPGETDNHQSKSVITLNSGSNQNSYRLTVFYKDTGTPPATVTFNWSYQ